MGMRPSTKEEAMSENMPPSKKKKKKKKSIGWTGTREGTNIAPWGLGLGGLVASSIVGPPSSCRGRSFIYNIVRQGASERSYNRGGEGRGGERINFARFGTRGTSGCKSLSKRENAFSRSWRSSEVVTPVRSSGFEIDEKKKDEDEDKDEAGFAACAQPAALVKPSGTERSSSGSTRLELEAPEGFCTSQ
ncbi:hypothetical protein AXG93_3228s1080 [Marchantia polymorpha subsp. ruderalis]|uniref:Uncharacterized protein n=1 Tax=Marchantia polymorpha subsp. ruderalis TaxID=1480154 RepID=A0A176WJ19_MARPO|nr:hypothetical protein AXG93_3228s1080 [Marchantia polymorpha subsp. ruderalis]